MTLLRFTQSKYGQYKIKYFIGKPIKRFICFPIMFLKGYENLKESYSAPIGSTLLILEIDLWFIFRKTYVSNIFVTSRKKVVYQIGPYISTFQTKMRNVCLSVILKSCQMLCSEARYHSTPAYVETIDT